MVGDGVFPVPCTNGTGPREDRAGFKPPPAAADGNILLVLRYPMAATLTTRAVRGEMTSLSAATDGAYFDTVRLVSRLGPYSRYQFTTQDEELDAAGCCSSSHPSFHAGDVAAGRHLYRGASFCEILG